MNSGITGGIIVILILAVVAHWPPVSVNMYSVVPNADVLIVAGLHVPAMPFVDVAGNEGGVEFWHKGPIGSNVGATWEVTITLIVADVPHCPPEGVKV